MIVACQVEVKVVETFVFETAVKQLYFSKGSTSRSVL